jgi:hypothetical protein
MTAVSRRWVEQKLKKKDRTICALEKEGAAAVNNKRCLPEGGENFAP